MRDLNQVLTEAASTIRDHQHLLNDAVETIKAVADDITRSSEAQSVVTSIESTAGQLSSIAEAISQALAEAAAPADGSGDQGGTVPGLLPHQTSQP